MRLMISSPAWIQPMRNPGARIFENEPRAQTLPLSTKAPKGEGADPS
jgi:hypothetical protein